MKKFCVIVCGLVLVAAVGTVAAQGPAELIAPLNGLANSQSNNQGLGPALGQTSGLPIPRFVSLKADKVNMHVGPAKDYEVKWRYQRAGLPVEITGEYENWRRIRDSDGTEGWVYGSLLSGRRTGVVALRSKDDLLSLRARPNAESAVVAQLQTGVLGTVKRCASGWCRLTGDGFDGWLPQEKLWGVYPNESVD
jgi:SH3-like domain-containing protein